MSRRISSIISIVRPYRLAAQRGVFSATGFIFGLPYTATDELKTRRFTPCRRMTSHKMTVSAIGRWER